MEEDGTGRNFDFICLGLLSNIRATTRHRGHEEEAGGIGNCIDWAGFTEHWGGGGEGEDDCLWREIAQLNPNLSPAPT